MMNIKRMAILGVAAIAAGAAALIVRSGMSSKPAVARAPAPQAVETVDVLVASKEVAPGHVLDPGFVRWEAWPKAATPASVITKTAQPDITKAVAGMVTREPFIIGQPITATGIVHTNATGFMAATITPGMRGISVPVTPDTGAGGFILPNDRVDVVLTRDMTNGSGPKNFQSETVLTDVRVLAIDQVARQEKDQQTVVGKTATLELTPEQTELISQAEQTARADNTGGLSLALRALGDSSGTPQMKAMRQRAVAGTRAARPSSIVVYRYGIVRGAAPVASFAAPLSDIPTAQPATPPNPVKPAQGPVALETSK